MAEQDLKKRVERLERLVNDLLQSAHHHTVGTAEPAYVGCLLDNTSDLAEDWEAVVEEVEAQR